MKKRNSCDIIYKVINAKTLNKVGRLDMKLNTRKVLALLLSLIMIASVALVPVSAAGAADQEESTSSFMDIYKFIVNILKKLFGLFGGSTGNSGSGIEYTKEAGKVSVGDPTDSTHASTIVKLNNGDLMAAWFGGSGEGDADVRIWYAIYSDGAWGEASVIPTEDTVAHWNPVLQNCGSYVKLYYKVGMEIADWVTKYVTFTPSGKLISEPKELVAGDTSGGRGPVRNKCIVTNEGVMIAPASTEQGTWRAFFDISEDGGITWKRTNYIVAEDADGNVVEMIQPTLWQDAEGDVHALFRTKANKIYRSDSFDGGYSWTEAYATDLPNNNSGIDVAITDNGWLWLAYNPISTNGIRNKLILSVSKDNGETWQDVDVLAQSANPLSEYSYPAIIAEGNTLYITYTYERTAINYAIIEFED